MKAATHQTVGVASALTTYSILYPLQDKLGLNLDWKIWLVLIIGNSIGSILPDIDHKGSLISKILFFLPVHMITNHRHQTHSLLATGLLWLILQLLIPDQNQIAFWFSLGVVTGSLSHILVDILNPNGVRLFYPLPWMIKLPLIRTGGIGEAFIGILFTALNVILSYDQLKYFFS